MRKIPVPQQIVESGEGWIGLPDEWLGIHMARRDEAIEAGRKKELPPVFINFAVAMALLDSWGNLPGLDGNPEKWDFQTLKWNLIAYITGTVFGDLDRELEVSKNSLPPLPTG